VGNFTNIIIVGGWRLEPTFPVYVLVLALVDEDGKCDPIPTRGDE